MKKLKLYLISLLLPLLAYANNAEAEAWKNGFITAYKAMKADSRIQGLMEEEIPTKRYVVYFDASHRELAEWDKLMVQMLGYTTSIYDPIRTKDDWIIFASFDSYGTAKQETKMLNEKVFRGQEKKLTVFDNIKNKKFFAAQTLLSEDILHLKELLKREHEARLKIAIDQKKQELHENQKVAIIYVDPITMEEIDPTKKRVIPAPKETTLPSPNDEEKEAKAQVPEKKKSESTKEKRAQQNARKAPVVNNPIEAGGINPPQGKFVLIDATVIAYRLSNNPGVADSTVFSIKDMEVADVVENNGEKHSFGAIVQDTDGLKYYKLHGKNLFIAASSAHRVEE